MQNDSKTHAPDSSCGQVDLLKAAGLVLVFCLSVAGSSVAEASQALIREGLWRITVTMSVPGMRADSRPFTHTQCFTSGDVRHGRNILQINPVRSPCQFVHYLHSRGRVSWNLQCRGRPAASGHVWLRYGNDQYEGAIAMRIDVPRHGQTIVMEQVRGRRIGDCR
ncbi:MAG: DUF3617 domain-containing protein [Acidiferrobacterales bacterium]